MFCLFQIADILTFIIFVYFYSHCVLIFACTHFLRTYTYIRIYTYDFFFFAICETLTREGVSILFHTFWSMGAFLQDKSFFFILLYLLKKITDFWSFFFLTCIQCRNNGPCFVILFFKNFTKFALESFLNSYFLLRLHE